MKWEYLTAVWGFPPTSEELDEHGEDGWELVAMCVVTAAPCCADHLHTEICYRAWFKREIAPSLAKEGS